jgi:thiol-disulfide isomerase/thioredoxin
MTINRFLIWTAALLAAVTQTCATHADESDAKANDKSITLEVRVVENNGKAVPGALVGLGNGYFSDPTWLLEKPIESNEDGIAKFNVNPAELEHACLAAHHASRGLVGFVEVAVDDVSKRHTIQLSAECRVTGRLVSTALEKLNERFSNGEIAIRLGDKIAVRHWSKRGDFALYLPPGKYEVEMGSSGLSGSQVHEIVRMLTVPGDKKELSLGDIELPLTRLKELEGQQAPELVDIAAWMNSKPLKLSDLRGKVVLLDFWGWWCGACTVRMPRLFSLHDKYTDDGLVVIGVHVDAEDSEVDSADEMYEKVAADRKEHWKGREIPFPVAFVRSGSPRVPHRAEEAARTARCELAASYGVTHYPTHVLIDRQGRVVGQFFANREDHTKLLERTLGIASAK